MSTVPPPQQPPYDPRTQWRGYREQQKAAWRAQRDAWKAQRYAWKSQYYARRSPSIVGPLVLVAVGIIGLLLVTGTVNARQFWTWYGHWWPLVLIAAGLGLLVEWFVDLRRETPVRRGGGFVGLIIFLAFIGIVAGIAASANDHWNDLRSHWGDDNGDFFNVLGRPQHDQDQQVLNTAVPANATIQIQNPRGSVSITAGATQNVQVEAHQVAFADSDDEAKKIFAAEAADVRVSGGAVVVKSAGHDQGRVDLTVTVPKSAAVTVDAGRGDVTLAGLGAGATITAGHGDVRLSDIQGSVQVHFSADKGDFSAHQVTGDITADGRCSDVTLSEIKGKVAISGDIFGEVHMENLAGGVHLHTSITDVEFGDLPGDMTLNDEDLHVTEAKGGVRLTTHSKNVDLAQITGDIFVDDRDGDITIEPAGNYGPNYSIDARNSSGHGDVVLTLPANASATVDARTRNGDIVSDFPLPSLGDEDSKQAKLVVGSGQAKISLSTDVGDVRIKRGSDVSSVPDAPKAPTPPKAPRAPRLKSSQPPAEPVTQ
jgi:DUF4097 and DUF4098 domain-containing protein YvlB